MSFSDDGAIVDYRRRSSSATGLWDTAEDLLHKQVESMQPMTLHELSSLIGNVSSNSGNSFQPRFPIWPMFTSPSCCWPHHVTPREADLAIPAR